MDNAKKTEKRCPGCFMAVKEGEKFCPRCGFDFEFGSRTDENALPIGVKLHGEYVIGRMIGRGGFGITYWAWEERHHRTVAIKELFPQNQAFLGGTVSREENGSSVAWDGTKEEWKEEMEEFESEATKTAALQEVSGVFPVMYRSFRENGTAYMALELVDGVSLRKKLERRGKPMNPMECFRFFDPIMDGLMNLYKRGMVYLDISPDNVMEDSRHGPRLVDLASVQAMDPGRPIEGVEPGQGASFRGAYSPAEQMIDIGQKKGEWNDVHALATTMLFAMTGDEPRGNPLEPSPDDDGLYKKLPRGVARVIRKARAGLGDRYKTMGEFRDGLKKALFLNLAARSALCLGIAAVVLSVGIASLVRLKQPDGPASPDNEKEWLSMVMDPKEKIQLVGETSNGREHLFNSEDDGAWVEEIGGEGATVEWKSEEPSYISALMLTKPEQEDISVLPKDWVLYGKESQVDEYEELARGNYTLTDEPESGLLWINIPGKPKTKKSQFWKLEVLSVQNGNTLKLTGLNWEKPVAVTENAIILNGTRDTSNEELTKLFDGDHSARWETKSKEIFIEWKSPNPINPTSFVLENGTPGGSRSNGTGIGRWSLKGYIPTAFDSKKSFGENYKGETNLCSGEAIGDENTESSEIVQPVGIEFRYFRFWAEKAKGADAIRISEMQIK